VPRSILDLMVGSTPGESALRPLELQSELRAGVAAICLSRPPPTSEFIPQLVPYQGLIVVEAAPAGLDVSLHLQPLSAKQSLVVVELVSACPDVGPDLKPLSTNQSLIVVVGDPAGLHIRLHLQTLSAGCVELLSRLPSGSSLP
jgi:hypothetical protein